MDDGDELDGTSFAQSGGKKRARKPTTKTAQNEKPAKKAKLTILEKQCAKPQNTAAALAAKVELTMVTCPLY